MSSEFDLVVSNMNAANKSLVEAYSLSKSLGLYECSNLIETHIAALSSDILYIKSLKEFHGCP